MVYDLPSFAAAPRRAVVEMPGHEPLLGPDRDPIADVVTRFLRAYLAGDTAGLDYLVPPDARITAAAGRLELLNVASVGVAGSRRDGRLVLATVQARDTGSAATYALRYRLWLVKRERWYVAEVNGAPGPG